MSKVERIIKKLTKYMAVVSVVGLIFIVLLTVTDIVLRYVINSPIIGSYEMVESTMIFTVFLAFAYCQSERGHVQVTLLIARYPRRVKFSILSLLGLASSVMSFMVLYAAMNQAKVAYRSYYTTAVIKIPLYPFYWAEVIAMAVLGLTFLFTTSENIYAIFNKKMADHLDQFLI